MSLNQTKASPEAAKLALLSKSSMLQTSLLANLIGSELGATCSAAQDVASIDDNITLVLVDCNGQNIDALSKLINELGERFTELPTALLNAEYDSEHEQLLDWPSIFGIFYQDTDQEQLVRGLERLVAGDYWVPRRLLHHFLDKNRRTPASGFGQIDINLTKREKQILKLIKGGATNAAISGELAVSEHTVKSHLYNVYKKIGVKNRLEASNWVRNIEGLD